MPSSEILRVDGIVKRYSPRALPAVDRVSLSLERGEMLGLLGPSGCGKTTLLRLIAGFERAEEGCIAIDGQVVAARDRWVPPEARDTGMVFQDFALFPHLTVRENVAFGLKARRKQAASLTRAQIAERVRWVLELVHLEGFQQRYPHELSGGQQQRVALARALAPHPRLILLDEPLSSLDAQVRLELREEIRRILKTVGISGVFVTHDREEAMAICDRVAILRAGRLEQCDTPEAIYGQPASRFVAEFVTQANFLEAVRCGDWWETEIGRFPIGRAEGCDGIPCCGRQGNVPERDRLATLTVPAERRALMLRQEDIDLEPDEASPIAIRDRQFLGREHRYCLQTPSGQLLHARTSTRLPVGASVRLRCRALPLAL